MVDHGYLSCEHHLYMTFGTYMATRNEQEDIVVVGLGGGGLCSFLQESLKNVNIQAIEIDEEILNVAKNYFGLKLTKKLSVNIEDGIEFIENCTKNSKTFKAILVDVDSKDPGDAIRCPPASFLSDFFLNNVKLCLKKGAMFILNFVCRDESVRESTLAQLRGLFKSVQSYKLEEDVNEVIFCTDAENLTVDRWKTSVGEMNALVKANRLPNSNLLDLEDFMKQLQL